jgi:hypothetical protein
MFTACIPSLALALMVPASLVAQDRVVQVGLVGGLNRSTMTGVGPVNAEFAGQAGLFAQFQLGSHFSFRPEMSVSWKRLGTSNQLFPPIPLNNGDDSPDLLLNQTTSLSWLEVPLLAQVALPQIGGGITPRLIAGPYVAIRLSCSVSSSANVYYDSPAGQQPSGPGATYSQSCQDATGAAYGNGDAGYVLGAGIGTKRFGLGLRWTRSLVATVPFNQFSNSPLMGGKQSTLSITLDVGIQ